MLAARSSASSSHHQKGWQDLTFEGSQIDILCLTNTIGEGGEYMAMFPGRLSLALTPLELDAVRSRLCEALDASERGDPDAGYSIVLSREEAGTLRTLLEAVLGHLDEWELPIRMGISPSTARQVLEVLTAAIR